MNTADLAQATRPQRCALRLHRRPRPSHGRAQPRVTRVWPLGSFTVNAQGDLGALPWPASLSVGRLRKVISTETQLRHSTWDMGAGWRDRRRHGCRRRAYTDVLMACLACPHPCPAGQLRHRANHPMRLLTRVSGSGSFAARRDVGQPTRAADGVISPAQPLRADRDRDFGPGTEAAPAGRLPIT